MGARRPRLFSFSREIEVSNLEGWAQPNELPLLYGVIDAFLRIAKTRKLADEDLNVVLQAVEHPSAGVQALGTARLAVLTHYFESARTAYLAAFERSGPGLQLTLVGHLPNTIDEVATSVLAVATASQDASVARLAERMGRVIDVEG